MNKEFVELKQDELREIQGGFPLVVLGVFFVAGLVWAPID